MSLTYLNPNAIKGASIEGTKLTDGSISISNIDGTVASKSYVYTAIDATKSYGDGLVGDINTFLESIITG